MADQEKDRLIVKAFVEVKATIILTEDELMALYALTNYGVGKFLEVFYQYLGKNCLHPHEKGLVSLFNAVEREVPELVANIARARKSFKGSGDV